MKHIGLVTCKEFRDEAVDDELLALAFKARGYEADRPNWDDDAIIWDNYDALIIRSTWNYQFRFNEFLNWVAQVGRIGVPLYNSPAVLRWNSNKSYLRDLESKGVRIPPTEWVQPGHSIPIAEIMRRRNWTKAVVKPQMGAGSHFTYLVSLDTAEHHPAAAQKELIDRGAIVQEFLPEIVKDGEWSFLYFGGLFSHAVIKKPKSGDFRTQNHYGGTYTATVPPQTLLDQTRAILDHAPAQLLYARVDGIVRDSRFMLIELEVFEPWFYLAYKERSEQAVVDAFMRMTSEINQPTYS